MDTTFKIMVDDEFLGMVKVYAEMDGNSSSGVFRDGAMFLMCGICRFPK